MKHMQLREAKARFSEIVDAAIEGEFTTITRHGTPVAMLISIKAAETLPEAKKKSFVDHLLAFPGPLEIEKDRRPPREIDL